MSHTQPKGEPLSTANRRSFLTRVVASVLAAILVVFPFAASWGVLFHPLYRRKKLAQGDAPLESATFTRICPLDALPADGVPHEFVVTADVADAWTRSTGQRIGSVFITRRDSERQPQLTAFTTTCPHLGCAVEFVAGEDRFECPCHISSFALDGEKLLGPSLRGLDPLAVKLVGEEDAREVWVAFQRFQAGIAERIPVG